jgi:tetratricopeptide (TPR) repeat protein
MRLSTLRFLPRISWFLFAVSPVILPAQQKVAGIDAARELEHQSPEWASIEKHLPNPNTASPKDLEIQADILRARRFPKAALDYYNYAQQRGGDSARIDKKIGMTHLEMREVELARVYFKKVVKINKKDSEGWNDLGAVEYIDKNFSAAVGDYKHAVKLEPKSAVYHSNLGVAYFDKKDYKNSSAELQTALTLDPAIFTRSSGSAGVSAHVLSAQDRARFCMEMAKSYARQGNISEMLHSLSVASEAGIDLIPEMSKDKVLAEFVADPRVQLIAHNAAAMRSGKEGMTEASGQAPAAQPSTAVE